MSKLTANRYLAALAVLATPAVAAASGGAGAMDMTHRMMMLVIQLGLILFAAKLANILFEKIRLPGALGELVAGMIIGPYALGQLGFYGFSDGLFPQMTHGTFAVSPELYGLASVAAVVLLFHIGLETDLKLLLRYSVVGALVGLGGLLASFFLGAASVVAFSSMLFGEQVGLFSPEALFFGTITTATSVGITARILSEKRKLDSPEGVTILSAAVIDDVMGIILLAVVMSLVTASRVTGRVDWGHVGIVGAKAVGVWLGATVLGLVASRKISFLLKWFGERTAIAVMALGLALILAGLFEEAGLAMIIGAYVMGLSLSEADISHVIREKLAPIYELLIPVFFCVTGMQINLGALADPTVVVFGLAYAVVALGAKVIGCGLPAMFANFNLRGASRIGFGMAPRCEVALIIAGVGLAANVLTPELLAAVIIMVAVNTIVAPPALMMLFRSPQRGTRKPVAEYRPETALEFEFPSLEMANFFLGEVHTVFESEGFFVHQISREPRLYQLRKEKSVIDIRMEGEKLTFYCHSADVRLVNAAMYEALAGLERSVKGLKQPLDAKAIRTGMLGAAPGPQRLNVAHYLRPELIVPHLRADDKGEVIDELLSVLVGKGLVHDADAARKAVWQREQSMSTGLQYGVAIPHGKTDAVDRLVCAVGIKPEGVDFESMDGRPTTIFVLTLSPQSKPAPHVAFMSTISQALNQTGRERVLECGTARQIYFVLTHPLPEPEVAKPRPRPARAPGGKFNLGEYLKPELLTPELSGETGEEVIRELLGLLERAGKIRDPAAALETVLGREAQMSTGMEEGIAVPHGRTDAVDELVCAVGVKPDGIDFGATDGKPSRIFVLVITPESGADPYLQFVASLMGALDAEGRRRLLQAETPEKMRRVFLEHEGHA